ncbi:MAG: cytochrome c [Gemmatimonadaceae bacterium]|nr:cytochrome c [Gemmatimonadaceae bacterium]
MRRSVLTTPALLLALGALAACGGGGEKAATTDTAAAVAPAATPAAAPAAGLDGKAEYLVCQTCHQENGEGLPNLYPPLAGSEWLTGEPEIAIAIVLHGMQGEITVKGQKYNNVMAPWASLSDAQIAAILTYERSSWGNTAAAVTADQVAAVRAATTSRTTPWTPDEVKAAKLK